MSSTASTPTMYERAEAIVDDLIKARRKGTSVAALAQQYGLRREAITTVLIEHGEATSTPAREAVLTYVRNNPGLSVDDLSIRLDTSKSSISRYLRGTPEQKLVVSRKQKDLSKFSDQEMFEALRSAYRQLGDERSKGLSRVRYNKLMEGTDAPAASTFIRRWGSWTVACEKAGITAAQPRRSNYVQEWTDDQIIEAVTEFVTTTGETTYHAYAAWAREHKRPSGPLLIMRWRSWAEARREALRRSGGSGSESAA